MGINLCRGCGLTSGSLGAFNMNRVSSYGETIYQANRAEKSQWVGG